MHVVERVHIGILNKAFFLALDPFQNAPRKQQPNGVDKIPTRFLMFEFYADSCRFKSRLGCDIKALLL